MKQIIRRWVLATGIIFLHTQVILAQQPTEVDIANESFNIEGWMFMGAGIAVCIAGVLLIFLNKLFTKKCIKSNKKNTQKSTTSTKEERMAAMGQRAVEIEKQAVAKKQGIDRDFICLKLVEVKDVSQSIKINLKDSVTLGRNAQKCNVIIKDDPTISGVHCKFYVFEDKVYLMDLGSTNGTFVNGKSIQYAVILKVGDVLNIGAKEYQISW